MGTRILLGAIILTLFGNGITLADRTLERSEILQIFEQLTSQPRKTWIPAGTIRATHEEYKAPKIIDPNELQTVVKSKIKEYYNNLNRSRINESLLKMDLDATPFNIRYELANEYTMQSSVVVKYDGERFYWEINIDSRTDSVTPDKELNENFMVNRFDRDWNQKRIFAWDGEKYTTYFLPGNHSIENTTGNSPPTVNGPLTAGIIPWGFGYYTYENLASLDSFAEEKIVDDETQIQLTLNTPDGIVTTFALAPSKNYALISYLTTSPGKPVTLRKYSNYQLEANQWIPMTILMENHDSQTNRLLTRDLWTITEIDTTVPGVENFNVNYEPDAHVEFTSPITEKPAVYRNSGAIDTHALLAERLAYAVSEGTQQQNCATAALKYTLSKSGKESTQNELASLVSATTGSTSLAAMIQFAQEKGLYCRAVKTDIQTLKNLNNCHAILHIPGKGHYVVLEAVDDKYVWTIDLTNNKFYYRADKDFFAMDWTEGTALLVSNQPISQDANLIEITGDDLSNIAGGAGYACNNLLQEYQVIYCSEPVGVLCSGNYYEYYERCGCSVAESGSCSSLKLVRYIKSPCAPSSDYPISCIPTQEWTASYMRACPCP